MLLYTKLQDILADKKWKLERIFHKPIANLKVYDVDDECWKEILPDYPNYFVSNFGNVKKVGKKSHLMNEDGFISPSSNGDKIGHLSVGVRNGKTMRRILVHQLVLRYHLNVDYDTSDMIIDHKDNNKQNNYVGNLEWVDSHINAQRSMINGCWNRTDRKQKVSHIDHPKYGLPNKITNIQLYKYRVCMNICGKQRTKLVNTKEEAIQTKKEFYAIMIISNYVKFKKRIYPKYYMLNINFKKIDDELGLL